MKQANKPLNIFRIKLPLYYFIISFLLGGGLYYLFFCRTKFSQDAGSSANTTTISNDQFSITRLEGYKYIRPLLFAEREFESGNLALIKQDIANYIDAEKKTGMLLSASVYLRVFLRGEWISVNSDSLYHPASMNKVPILITYLHMAESYNSLMNQKLFFEKHDKSLPVQTYTSKSLEPGHSYTIQELLHYMIAYSDNDATFLLLEHINLDMYNKTFTDIGLAKPSFKYDEFLMTARQYSLFMKELYNASYLSIPASEYATNLLTECDFKEGLLKKLPSTVVAAHKFGESGYGNVYELHESGIIYMGKNAYLITIMTKGTNIKYLSGVIADLSNLVYNKVTFD